MPEYQTLEYSVYNHIGIIKLNRPSAANGISITMASELLQAATHCEESDDVRAVLITGNGKLFSAGGDLKDFASFGDKISSKIKELMVYLHAAVSRFARMDKPVVIAVNGTAAGAGFSLACAGDIVYSAESAKFMMAYTGVGLTPDGGSTYHLPRLIGMRRTQELMLTNRSLNAQEALQWGIVTRIFPDIELYDAAIATATQLANGPTLAYANIKKLLLDSPQQSLETQMECEARSMGAMVNTEDGRNGINAFIEKRKPEFKGI